MSKSRFWYVLTDIAVILDRCLTPRDKTVFMVLRVHADRETRTTVLAMKTIADEAVCSERSALNAINTLVKRGVIERNIRFRGNRQSANSYRIIGHEAECYQKDTPPENCLLENRTEDFAEPAENDVIHPAISAEDDENCTHEGANSADRLLKPLVNEKEKTYYPLTPQGEKERETDAGDEKRKIGAKTKAKSSESEIFEAIRAAYNEILPELPNAVRITASRLKDLKQRIRDDLARNNPDWWRQYFRSVKEYPWLMGRNPDNWRANFDWLIGDRGMQKVIEGGFIRQNVSETRSDTERALQKKFTDEGGEVNAKDLLRELGIS